MRELVGKLGDAVGKDGSARELQGKGDWTHAILKTSKTRALSWWYCDLTMLATAGISTAGL